MTNTTAAPTTLVEIEVGYQDTRDHSELARATRWTPAATGHTYWTFAVEMGAVLPVETIAEAVFEADNAPFEVTGLAGQIRDAMIAAYEQTTDRHHSLSVGDRVRIGEVEVVCSDYGFRRIYR